MAVVQSVVFRCGERAEAMDTRNLWKKQAAHEKRCKKCKEQE